MNHCPHRHRLRYMVIAFGVYASLYAASGWAKEATTYVCRTDPHHSKQARTLEVSPEAAKELAKQGRGYIGPCTIDGDKRSIGDGYREPLKIPPF